MDSQHLKEVVVLVTLMLSFSHQVLAESLIVTRGCGRRTSSKARTFRSTELFLA